MTRSEAIRAYRANLSIIRQLKSMFGNESPLVSARREKIIVDLNYENAQLKEEHNL